MSTKDREILGKKVEVSKIENSTLKAVFSSEIENLEKKWNGWYNDGDSYADWGDIPYLDQSGIPAK